MSLKMKSAAVIILLSIHIHNGQCNYAKVASVGCWDRDHHPGKGWDNKQWPAGSTNVTEDNAPAKKVLRVADVTLSQKAVQHPNKHVALLCEVWAPWVDLNALFMTQEGDPRYTGEMGTIEKNSYSRRFFLRGRVNGHGYKVRLQFFGSYAPGGQTKATPPTMTCGVVYPLFPNAESKGCEFIQIIN